MFPDSGHTSQSQWHSSSRNATSAHQAAQPGWFPLVLDQDHQTPRLTSTCYEDSAGASNNPQLLPPSDHPVVHEPYKDCHASYQDMRPALHRKELSGVELRQGMLLPPTQPCRDPVSHAFAVDPNHDSLHLLAPKRMVEPPPLMIPGDHQQVCATSTYQAHLPALSSNVQTTPTTNHAAQKLNSQREVCVGRWSADEHKWFLKGLEMFQGPAWGDIARLIGTRTSTQVRTHAQKYFTKLARANQVIPHFESQILKERARLISQGIISPSPDEVTTTTPTATAAKKSPVTRLSPGKRPNVSTSPRQCFKRPRGSSYESSLKSSELQCSPLIRSSPPLMFAVEPTLDLSNPFHNDPTYAKRSDDFSLDDVGSVTSGSDRVRMGIQPQAGSSSYSYSSESGNTAIKYSELPYGSTVGYSCATDPAMLSASLPQIDSEWVEWNPAPTQSRCARECMNEQALMPSNAFPEMESLPSMDKLLYRNC